MVGLGCALLSLFGQVAPGPGLTTAVAELRKSVANETWWDATKAWRKVADETAGRLPQDGTRLTGKVLEQALAGPYTDLSTWEGPVGRVIGPRGVEMWHVVLEVGALLGEGEPKVYEKQYYSEWLVRRDRGRVRIEVLDCGQSNGTEYYLIDGDVVVQPDNAYLVGVFNEGGNYPLIGVRSLSRQEDGWSLDETLLSEGECSVIPRVPVRNGKPDLSRIVGQARCWSRNIGTSHAGPKLIMNEAYTFSHGFFARHEEWADTALNSLDDILTDARAENWERARSLIVSPLAYRDLRAVLQRHPRFYEFDGAACDNAHDRPEDPDSSVSACDFDDAYYLDFGDGDRYLCSFRKVGGRMRMTGFEKKALR